MLPVSFSMAAVEVEEVAAKAGRLIEKIERLSEFSEPESDDYRGVDRLRPFEILKVLREYRAGVTTEARWIVFQAWAENAKSASFNREAEGRRSPIAYQLFNSDFDLRQANLIRSVFENIGKMDRSSIETEGMVVGRYIELIESVSNHHQAEFVEKLIRKNIVFTEFRIPYLRSLLQAINSPGASEKAIEFFLTGGLPRIKDQVEILQLIDSPGTNVRIAEIESRIEHERHASVNELIRLLLVLNPADPEGHWRRIAVTIARLDGDSLEYLLAPLSRPPSSPQQAFLKLIRRPMMELLERSLTAKDQAALKAAASAREPLPPHLVQVIQVEPPQNTTEIHAFFRGTKSLVREQFKRIDASLSRYFSSSQARLEPAHFRRFFEILIKVYFSRLPQSMRLRILEGLLEQPRQLSDAEIFRVVIHRSGPNLQKLMQTIARESGLNDEFARTLKSLEEDVETTSFENGLADLTSAYPGLFGPGTQYRFSNNRPFGGTIAQTFESERRQSDGSWSRRALRVRRPRIDEVLRVEERLLRAGAIEIQSAPELQGTSFERFDLILEPILRATRGELDFTKAAHAQIKARELYSRTYAFETASQMVDVVVPQVDTNFSRSDILDQEYVRGESFEEFFRDRGAIKVGVIEAFAAVWFREALLTSGFHHADPHQGNIRFREGPNKKIQVILLDFGLTGETQPATRRSLVLLSQALKSKDRARIKDLTAEVLIEAEAPISVVDAAIKQGLTDVKRYIEFLIQSGLAVRQEVISLKRGMMLVDQLLRLSGSRQSLDQIAMQVGREFVVADLKLRATTLGRKYLTPLKMSDMPGLYKSQGPKTGSQDLNCPMLFN